jgi:hypothetical protein
MSGLFAAMGQGLSAAGYGAADLYGKQALNDQQSELEISRQERLAEFKAALDERTKNAPLNRLSEKAKNFAQEGVPQEAPPVSNLTGAGLVGINPDVEPDSKFVGNPQDVLKGIMALPDGPDKEAALRQLQGQVQGDAALNAQSVAGKTRKRTPQEAVRAAVQDAAVNDMPAYAAYESQIGKPLRDERKIDNSERREDNRAALSAQTEDRKERQMRQQLETQLARLDLQQGSLDAQNKKTDALIEHWERRDDIAAQGKAGAQDRASTIVNAMNNTIRDLDNNKPGAKAAAEEKSAWTTQRSNAVAVRARAMLKLNSALDDNNVPPAPGPAAAPATAPGAPAAAKPMAALPPGSKQIGTSNGKPVWQAPDGSRFVEQ